MKHPLRIFAVEGVRPNALPSRATTGAHNGLHAAILAHEIKNALAGLELFVSLFEEEPERRRETINQMQAGLRRLSGTVENVLAMESGAALRLEPLALGPAVAAIVEFARPVVEQAGLRLRFQGAELESRAMASAAGLQQIVLNLLLNSIRFTETPGEIRITLEKHGKGRCRLSVADAGAGIAPEHLPHIFKPGWSAREGSPGLGLAVCRRIATAHGTVLEAGSAPGCGTVFSMELRTL